MGATDISLQVEDLYYYQFSQGVLWPLLHGIATNFNEGLLDNFQGQYEVIVGLSVWRCRTQDWPIAEALHGCRMHQRKRVQTHCECSCIQVHVLVEIQLLAIERTHFSCCDVVRFGPDVSIID